MMCENSVDMSQVFGLDSLEEHSDVSEPLFLHRLQSGPFCPNFGNVTHKFHVMSPVAQHEFTENVMNLGFETSVFRIPSPTVTLKFDFPSIGTDQEKADMDVSNNSDSGSTSDDHSQCGSKVGSKSYGPTKTAKRVIYEEVSEEKLDQRQRNKLSALRYRNRKKNQQMELASSIGNLSNSLSEKDSQIASLTTENEILKSKLNSFQDVFQKMSQLTDTEKLKMFSKAAASFLFFCCVTLCVLPTFLDFSMSSGTIPISVVRVGGRSLLSLSEPVSNSSLSFLPTITSLSIPALSTYAFVTGLFFSCWAFSTSIMFI